MTISDGLNGITVCVSGALYLNFANLEDAENGRTLGCRGIVVS